MRQKDRNRVQVPRSLPDWMDGPFIKAKAKEWGVSYLAAKLQLKRKSWSRKYKKKTQ